MVFVVEEDPFLNSTRLTRGESRTGADFRGIEAPLKWAAGISLAIGQRSNRNCSILIFDLMILRDIISNRMIGCDGISPRGNSQKKGGRIREH